MSEENQSQNTDGNWYDGFPSEVQQWDEVKNSEGSDQFWQRITSHRKHLGQSIRLPSEEASVDDMNAFYDKLQNKVSGLMPTPDLDNADAIKGVMQKLGLPDEVSGYSDVEGEDMTFNEGQLDIIKTLSLNAGLTKTQFKALASQIGVNTATEIAGAATAKSEAADALKQEWGMVAEDRMKETGEFLTQSKAPQSLIDAMSNSELDASTTMWLHGLSQGMSETSEGSSQSNNLTDGKLTPYEAQERITEMLGNTDHPYHRGDKMARGRMHELMAMTATQ